MVEEEAREEAKPTGTKPTWRLFGSLVSLSCFVLCSWWLQREYVGYEKKLHDAGTKFKEVPSDSIDPTNEGKLVLVHGMLICKQPKLVDKDYGITAEGIALARNVEEFHPHSGARTSYESWDLVKSDDKDDLLACRVFRGKEFVIGAFTIAPEVVKHLRPNIDTIKNVKIPESTVSASSAAKKIAFAFSDDGKTLYPEKSAGKTRIQFAVVPSPTEITVVAKQQGAALVQSDDPLFDPEKKAIIEPGNQSAATMGESGLDGSQPTHFLEFLGSKGLAFAGMFVCALAFFMFALGDRAKLPFKGGLALLVCAGVYKVIEFLMRT